jgi:hypothetical protein
MHMNISENRRILKEVSETYPFLRKIMVVCVIVLLLTLSLVAAIETGHAPFLSLKLSDLLKAICLLSISFITLITVFWSLKAQIFIGGPSEYGRIATTSKRRSPVQYWVQAYLLWPGVVALCLLGAYHWLSVYLNA